MENANIFWGIVAGVGLIIAAIGTLWAWLPPTLSIGALWVIGGGACMTVIASNLIVD